MKESKVQKVTGLWLLVVLMVLLSLAQSLFAKTYSYDLENEGWYIWDLSGTYSEEFFSISYTMAQDGKGKFYGSGSASGNVLGYDFDMVFDITGTVKQKAGIATVKINFKFKGWVSDGYEVFKFKATEKITANIDTVNLIMEGICKVCISGYGCDTLDFSMDVPAGMDGSSELTWNVDLNAKNKWSGNAVLTISNDDSYNFTVTGKYNPKKDISDFKLKGFDASKGFKINIKIDESDGNIETLKGKVLGQSL